jgi:hypothetical protein
VQRQDKLEQGVYDGVRLEKQVFRVVVKNPKNAIDDAKSTK